MNKYYYEKDGKRVFTALFHIDRGKCCGNKCLHCPFIPKYEKSSTKINEKLKKNV